MSTKISPREVLAYLNHLGYNNVNPQQLKDFMNDLKKLIKYEERKKWNGNGEDVIGYPHEESKGKKLKGDNSVKPKTDIFSELYLHGTCASKAKTVPKKESVISLKIKKSQLGHFCVCQDKENVVEPEVVNCETEKTKELHEHPNDNQEQNINRPSSKSSLSKKSNVYKAKSSFIRPLMQISNKSDPVALYHQYQACWKRQKLPGEDNRTELRWAIREKMLSGPR